MRKLVLSIKKIACSAKIVLNAANSRAIKTIVDQRLNMIVMLSDDRVSVKLRVTA